ncbi:polymerase [Lasius niger]|uniref:Polymerase n=1 Tax=Lasius niger TaxID=67767 RepID=A0A0J7JTQ0_LASNI|nr:polymerase [Lasius niger]
MDNDIILPIIKRSLPEDIQVLYDRQNDEKNRNIHSLIQFVEKELAIKETIKGENTLNPDAKEFRPRTHMRNWRPQGFRPKLGFRPPQPVTPQFTPGSTSAPRQIIKNIKCYKCNKVGHIQRNCPLVKQQKN